MTKSFNPYTVRDGIAYVELSQGQTTLIDADDLHLIQGHHWHAGKYTHLFYAKTNIRIDGKFRTLRMHHLILPLLDGMTVDHISRDGLDNRRSNLRYATSQQQAQNRRVRSDSTNGYRGISKDKRWKKWRAKAVIGGQRFDLGYYSNILDAVAARRAFDEAHNIPPASPTQKT